MTQTLHRNIVNLPVANINIAITTSWLRLNRLFCAMLAAVLICVAGTAAAQGPPRPEKPSSSSALEQFNTDSFLLDTDPEQSQAAYFGARKFADCVRGISEDRLIGLLATYPGSGEEIRGLQTISQRYRGCVVATSAMPTAYVRGAMAESLLARDDEKQQLAAANLAQVKVSPYPTGKGKEAEQVKTLRAAYRCLAFSSPAMAANVLAKETGSEIEKKSLDFLFSSAPGCAGRTYPRGASVQMQRAILAESLYDWAEEAKAG